MDNGTLLQARGICKCYGAVHVLNGVNLSVEQGEIVAIVGASGAGKSTLLHVLGTLEAPDQGEVWLAGTPLHTHAGSALAQLRNRSIGFIFQFHCLLPEFTALENVCLPAYIAGRAKVDAREAATTWLERLGLADRLHHMPDMLSGGEAQRVAVARALINRPDIIYADEPSGNLDSENAQNLYALFTELCQTHKQTLVLVTHNESLVAMATRVLHMRDGTLS